MEAHLDKPAKPTENSVLLPVTLPAGVEGRLGYTARRRYFVAYWEPAVGKPVLDDGQPSSGGVGQHWLYLDLVNQYWARDRTGGTKCGGHALGVGRA